MCRGVVFIAEIVPRLAIAKAARWFYGENYVSRHMKHSLEMSGQRKTRDYGWRNRGNRYGKELPKVFRKKPDSAFVAEGSAVSVYSGTKIA